MNVSFSKIVKIGSLVTLVGLLVGALALAFPAAVQAQDTNPPTQSAPTTPVEKLEKAYQAELKHLDAQTKRLEAADTRTQKAAERIANLKSKGKDTTVLEQELADFKDSLKSAHSDHDSAASILSTHAGFDASGKVTDAKLAQDTVQQARRLLRETPQTLRPAIRDLVRAVRQFIRDNRRK
jgi:hypothetical protein